MGSTWDNYLIQPTSTWTQTPWNFSSPTFGSTSSSTESSSSSSLESDQDANYKKAQQMVEASYLLPEALSKKNELTKQLDEIRRQKAQIESAQKDENGNIQIEPQQVKLNTLSTFEKIKRGGLNMLSGIGNVCKTLVGYENVKGANGKKESKWNPLKCLRNLGIAAAVATACVFAAPVGAALATALGGGAIATGIGTAVASLPTVLTYAGLASGVYTVGKGVVNLQDAETTEQFDAATQDIGAGAFEFFASKAGLKAINKSAGVTSVSEGGLFSLSRIGAGLKNLFVNPWKAANVNTKTCMAAIQAAPTKWKGFLEAGKYMRQSGAREATKEFENTLNSHKTKLQQDITKIDEALRLRTAISEQERALLEFEKSALEKNLTAISDAKDFATWQKVTNPAKAILEEIRGYQKAFKNNSEVEIGGVKFTGADGTKLTETLARLEKDYKKPFWFWKSSFAKDLQTLKEQRFNSMQKLAGFKDNKTLVEDFGYTDKRFLGLNVAQPYNWAQGLKGKWGNTGSILMNNKMNLFNGAILAVDPAWIAQSYVKNPAFIYPRIEAAVDPIREATHLETILKEQIDPMLAQAKEQEAQLEQAIAECDKIININQVA